MGDQFDKFLRLKPIVKVGITLALVAAIGGGYYSLFYSEIEAKITAAQQQRETLRGEKTSYEKRKVEYIAYKNELNELLEEKRELLKALPSKAEIPAFLQNIQEQASMAGLEVINFTLDPDMPQQLYVKIPVRMEVRGTYHQITRFFKNISELRRIVNVQNLGLQPERGGNKEAGPTKIRARFIAATFRYLEQGDGKR